MNSKNIKIKIEFTHCFESGDLCRDQYGNMAVIIEVLNKAFSYRLINLQSTFLDVIGMPRQEIKKGSISTQPCLVFDKYHYLYNPIK